MTIEDKYVTVGEYWAAPDNLARIVGEASHPSNIAPRDEQAECL